MRKLVNNWLYGEVSPLLTGRLDTDIYSAGCARLENMYVHRQGGISRRPPLKKVVEIPPISGRNYFTRQIPFHISSTAAYTVLIGPKKDENTNSCIAYTDGTNIYPFNFTDETFSNRYHTTWGVLTESQLRDVRFANYYNDLYLVHKNCPMLLVRYTGTGLILAFPTLKVNQDVKRYNIQLSISSFAQSPARQYDIYVEGKKYTVMKTENMTLTDFLGAVADVSYDGWTAELSSSKITFIAENEDDKYRQWRLASGDSSQSTIISGYDFYINSTFGMQFSYEFSRIVDPDEQGLVFAQDDFLDMSLNTEGNYASDIDIISERMVLAVNGNPCRIYMGRPYGTSQIIYPPTSNDTILDFVQFEIVSTDTEVMKDKGDMPVTAFLDSHGENTYLGTSHDQRLWKFIAADIQAISTKNDYDAYLRQYECEVTMGEAHLYPDDTAIRRVTRVYLSGDFTIVWKVIFRITDDDEVDYSKLSKDANGDYYSSRYRYLNSGVYTDITVDDAGTNGLKYNYVSTDDVYINSKTKYYTRSGAGTQEDPYVYTFVSDPQQSSLGLYYERTVVFSDDYKTKVYEQKGCYTLENDTVPFDVEYDDVNGRIMSMTKSGTIYCKAIPYYQYDLTSDSNIYDERTDVNRVATASTGIEVQLATGRNDHISWIALGDYIMAGTESSEWRMDTAINALDSRASKYSAFGSTNGLVAYVGTDLIFLQKGNKLRLLYKDNYGLQNIELTVTNPDITSGNILNMYGVMEPEPALVILKSETVDNVEKRSIVFLSVDRANGVQAFSRWTTDLWILDICTVEKNGEQKITALCMDTYNNTVKYMIAEFDFNDIVYSDCGYDGSFKNHIHVYGSSMRALPFDTQTQDGSVTLGESKNVSKIVFRCLDTGRIITWHNEKDRNISRTPICCDRNGDYVGGLADFSMNVNGGTTSDLMISVEAYEDEPMTLLAMAYELRVNRNG